MKSANSRFTYAADYALIAAAVVASLQSEGAPRVLSVLALGLSLALLFARWRASSAIGFWRWRSTPKLALLGGVLGLLILAALWNARSRPERLPFESPNANYLPSATRACLAKPEVEAYLRVLHGDLIEAWAQPEAIASAQRVVIEFTLLPSGDASEPRVVTSTNPSSGRSALEALSRVGPFAPLGPEAACLSGSPVRLSLANLLE